MKQCCRAPGSIAAWRVAPQWCARYRRFNHSCLGVPLQLPSPLLQGKLVPYCQVQGNLNDVAAACSANGNCKAFTTTSSGGGYLKTAAGPTSYAEGVITYKKA